MPKTRIFPFMFGAAECLTLFSDKLEKLQQTTIDCESTDSFARCLCDEH